MQYPAPEEPNINRHRIYPVPTINREMSFGGIFAGICKNSDKTIHLKEITSVGLSGL